jgi:hypothetical protein
MSFKEKIENFIEATRELTLSWEEDVEMDSPEDYAISNTGEFYPFQLPLEELYINVHTWGRTVIDEIERGESLNFCSTDKYVMSLKGCQEDEHWFEVNWMYRVKEYDGSIRLVEEIEGGSISVTWEFLKENFISVPKEIFELYVKSCIDGDGNACVKIQELGKIMGEKI